MSILKNHMNKKRTKKSDWGEGAAETDISRPPRKLPSKNKDLLKWAKMYHSKGLSIIPVRSDKKPTITSWKEYQERKPTEEEIQKWFSDSTVTGIAVITGKISGVVVIDCEKDFDYSLVDFPETVVSRTGGGGKHFFFRYPKNIKVGNKTRFLPNADVRGDGGYVLVPPSLHYSGGSYEWEKEFDRENLTDLPEWFLKESSQPNIKPRVVSVAEGQRNRTATEIIGKLVAHLPESDWDSVALPLLEAWNETNIPPMGIDELQRVYTSITEREQRKHTSSFKPISFRELQSLSSQKTDWLVEDLFPSGSVNILSGYPASYKTWLLLHIALCVSKGVPVFGKFQVKQGKVLVVDEENIHKLLCERLSKLGVSEDSDMKLSVYAGLKLDSKHTIEALRAYIQKEKISLVTIDSLVRIHDKEENDAKQISDLFASLRKLSDTGVTVIITHHNRKPSVGKSSISHDLRGSSDILASADGHIAVSRKEKERIVKVSQNKMRFKEETDPFEVELVEKNGIVIPTYIGVTSSSRPKRDVARERVVELVSSGTDTRKAIVEALSGECGVATIDIVLKELVNKGLLSVSTEANNLKRYSVL